jgi:hypothetical protein
LPLKKPPVNGRVSVHINISAEVISFGAHDESLFRSTARSFNPSAEKGNDSFHLLLICDVLFAVCSPQPLFLGRNQQDNQHNIDAKYGKEG